MELRDLLFDDGTDLIGNGGGLIHLGADGRGDVHRHDAHVHIRQQHHLCGGTHHTKEHHQRSGNRHTGLQVTGKIAQKLEIGLIDLSDDTAKEGSNRVGLAVGPAEVLSAHLLRVQHHVTKHRHQGQRHEHGTQDQEGDGQAEIVKEHAGHTAGQTQGQEHSNGGQSGSHYGSCNFLGALHAAFQTVIAFRGITVDIFQNNDGAVHDHANTHGDTAKAHHVHGQVEHIHQNEHRQDTNRHGHGDGHGGAPAAQEQKHHDGCQDNTQIDVLQHGADDHIDVVRGQIGRRPAQGRVLFLQLRHPLRHGLSRAGLVGTGLLGDLQNDAGRAVHLGNVIGSNGFHCNICHLAEANQTAGGERNEHVSHIFQALELGVGGDGQGLGAVLHITAGQQQVFCHEDLGDIFLGKAVGAGPGGIHLHGDLLGNTAADRDLRNTVDTLQRGGNGLLGHILQLAQVITDEGDHGRGHQIAEVHIHDHGIDGAIGKGESVKLLPQLHGSHIQIRTVGIGDLQLADAVGGTGTDRIHARDGHDGSFQGTGQKILHVAGGSAVIIRVHHGHGRFQIRKQSHLQLGGKHRAEDGDHDDRKDGCNFMADTKFCAHISFLRQPRALHCPPPGKPGQR